MGRKPRCSDVAEAIIEYFRRECAISSSSGIETTVENLAVAIGSSHTAVGLHLRRMMDLSIITLKGGSFVVGNSQPKFLALGEGHEEGDEWKKTYYSENKRMFPLKTNAPLLASEIVKYNAKANSDKNMIEELIKAYARIDELQKKILEIQQERNSALETIQQQKSHIEELEHDLKLESESVHKNQQDITTLELQLRQVMSQVASNERRIAKNDEKPQVAFASR